jgi:4-amino-4-deoxy-L-arabinose transferase-like glycosyltransferase
MTPRAPGRLGPAIFAAAALLFLAGLPAHDLWHVDENRYAEVARVMTLPGADLLVPHLNGQVYPEKPPGFFWAVAWLHGGLGLELPLAAKLPSVLGAALAVLAVFGIGRRLYGRSAGLAAALALATGVGLGGLARRAQLDAFLTAFTTLAAWAWVEGAFAPRSPAARRGFYTSACLLAGLGVLVKGPVALMVPGSAILVQRIWQEGRRALRSPWLLAAPLLALLPVALWLAAATADAGRGYFDTIVLGRGIGHALGRVDKVRPFWFYLGVFPVGALPWTFLLPAAGLAFARWRRAEEQAADRFALAWLLVPLALFSLSPAKRNLYLTPVYPALALWLGRLARDLLEPSEGAQRIRHPWVSWGARALAVAWIAIGAGALAAAGLAPFAGSALERIFPAWKVMQGEATPGLLLRAALLGGATALGGVLALRRASPRAVAGGLAAAALGFSLLWGSVVTPLVNPAVGARAFVQRIAPIVGDAPIGDYAGGADFVLNWALPREVVPILKDRAAAESFVAEHAGGPVFLVVDRPDLSQQGLPDGLVVLVEGPRPLEKDLLLLGRPGPLLPASLR